MFKRTLNINYAFDDFQLDYDYTICIHIFNQIITSSMVFRVGNFVEENRMHEISSRLVARNITKSTFMFYASIQFL